ncbi:MAG: flagellar biosynthetic protein FliQ, partial [Planctomycetaceae bacterium]
MDTQIAIDLCRQALVSALLLVAPILLVGMVMGLVIGLIQAV